MNYSKLENIRKGKKITQSELAGKVGISESTYKKNIANKNMTVAVLENVAKELGVSIKEFFEDNVKLTELNEEAGEYGKKNKDLTEKLLASKDEIIEKQKEEIQFLRGIIKNQK